MSGVCALLPHKRRTVTRRTLINGNNHNDISAKANGLKTPIRVSIRYIFSQNEKDSNTGSTLAHWSAGSRLSRQTAAHRRRLWATGTPIPVRQGPISAYGAPQSLAQRAEPASRCGCLATVRVTSRKQGRHPQSAPFPFPKLSLSICRTKRKKPYLPKRNQATSEL